MALTESRPLFIRLTLPDGLEEALEGLAREVLRHQPENILDFAANHFDQLLKKRATSATKKSEILENGIDNELQSIEDEDGIEVENIEEVEPSPRDTAVKDEILVKNDSEKYKTSIDVQIPITKDVEEDEEPDIDLNDIEVQNAATKIQAGFRGHKTRKELQDRKQSSNTVDENVDIDLTDPDVEQAATKIQAGFRGHKTRKALEEKKSDKNADEAQRESSIDIDLTDPDVEVAATKIQA